MYTLDNILKYSTTAISHNSIILVGKDEKPVYIEQLFNSETQTVINNILTNNFKDVIEKSYDNVEVLFEDLSSYDKSYIFFKSDINFNQLEDDEVQFKDLYKRNNYIVLHLGEVKLVPTNNSTLHFFQIERMKGKFIKQSFFQKEAAGHEVWVNDTPVNINDIALNIEVIWYKYPIKEDEFNSLNLPALNVLQKEKEKLKEEYNSISDTKLKNEKRKQYDELNNRTVDTSFLEKIRSSYHVKKEILTFNEDGVLSFEDGSLNAEPIIDKAESISDEPRDVDFVNLEKYTDLDILDLSEAQLKDLSTEIYSWFDKLDKKDMTDIEMTTEEKSTYAELLKVFDKMQLRSAFLRTLTNDANYFLIADMTVDEFNNKKAPEEINKYIEMAQKLLHTYIKDLKFYSDKNIVNDSEKQIIKDRIKVLKEKLNIFYQQLNIIQKNNSV